MSDGQRVSASVHSDDWVYDVSFDATPYFEASSDETLAGLLDTDFAHSYEADYVALAFIYEDDEDVPYNSDIAVLMDYVHERDGLGFEVIVDRDEALAWLRTHRPQALALASDTEVFEEAVPFLDPEQVEALLVHEDRRVRMAAIAALGQTNEDRPSRSR